MSGVLHLVCPRSLETWFEHFVTVSPGDHVEWLGEDGDLSTHQRRRVESLARDASTTVLHSSHYSLVRDADLGADLAAAGHDVVCQSRCGARHGVDKLLMKSTLDEQHIPQMAWREAGDAITPAAFAAAHEGPVVVKQRHGTEGKMLRLAPEPAVDLDPADFEEPFVSGVEYSVVLFRSPTRVVTFPSVWKGPTRRDLLPPYRRLRLCPAPRLSADMDRQLRELSVRTAAAVDSVGLTEVELLVGDDGMPLVIEINPRIAGTMRMAALAAATRIFDVPVQDAGSVHLEPTRCALELPSLGPPWNEPDAETFCTSRLTVGAESWSEVVKRLTAAEQRGAMLPPDWRTQVRDALAEVAAGAR
jgi:predicted ATP-grasp superfamily ATP-dependent carboligase